MCSEGINDEITFILVKILISFLFFCLWQGKYVTKCLF